LKEILTIKDNLINKISYYHLLGYLLMLPFDQFYTELILISFVLHTLINLRKEKVLSLGMPFLLLSSIFFLTLFCVLYSQDKQQAFKDLEKQLAIVLFPFLFSVTALDIGKYKMRLLKAFAIGCTITILYLYADAWRIIEYNKLPIAFLSSSAFVNNNFSAPIGLHPTYLSMYLAISIPTFLYFLIVSDKIYLRIFYAAGLIVLSAGMLQLSSRSVLVALLLIINFIIPFFLLSGKSKKAFILISLLFSFTAVLIILKTDSLKKRLVTDLKSDLGHSPNYTSLQESRMTRWECAWQLIRQSPVIGYGSGSETNLLKDKYFDNHLFISYLNELNAHNEYLSFLLKSGFPGLILYLFILAASFANAWRSKDALWISFLAIIFFVSFSENILDVNKGIFFFSFFLSFFSWPISNLKVKVSKRTTKGAPFEITDAVLNKG
jgi:O-antigen ligase